MTKDENAGKDITKAYRGGEGAVNSFSHFGKRRKKTEEAEKETEKNQEEDRMKRSSNAQTPKA